MGGWNGISPKQVNDGEYLYIQDQPGEPQSKKPDISPPGFTPGKMTGKRIMDLLLGSMALLITAPLLGVLMLIIKYDTSGPAIFKQQRLGRYGNEFTCYKLRTMYVGQEQLLDQHLQEYPLRYQEWLNYGKIKGDDPRVTPCGKWLRSWSLDEIPQIINVIKGEMSLVGPRPYLCAEKELMGELAEVILSVPPGITGLWQVSGRNQIDFVGRLEIEKKYVMQHNFLSDLFIIFKTIPVVLSRKGAY